MHSKVNLKHQFNSLDKLLYDNRHWWQFGAFFEIESRWKKLAPDLHLKLEKHSSKDSSSVGVSVDLSQPFEDVELNQFIPDLAAIKRLTNIESNYQTLDPPNPHWQYQIAGRKWSQISCFAPHVPIQHAVVEWCAGKGHLGRLVASNNAKSILSIEWKQALCDKNEQLNQRLEIIKHYCPAEVTQCDVLSQEISRYLSAHHFPIALHACGDLHTQLVKKVVTHDMHGLCLAPCCYNLIAQQYYQPLSSLAKKSLINLSKLDLSLPLKKVVTAGQRERNEQSKEKLWRVAFDSWQRNVRSIDQYMPLPTIPKRILKSDFKSFILWASEIKKQPQLMQQADEVDVEKVLRQATKRMPAVQQMEWVQSHFQRAVEVWLLLDQALYLAEHGYQCEIIEFCEQAVTPRNLMLKANKG